MKNLVIGRGEIGKSIIEVLQESGQAVNSYDIVDGPEVLEQGELDILHIAIPYSVNFDNIVQTYFDYFSPTHIIVYSTVPIGTCERLGVVHSPVEGRHPDLALSIRSTPRWLGTSSQEERVFFNDFFRNQISLQTRLVASADYTEFLKLRSTSRYGINLVFADYEKRVADEIGMDWELLKEFDRNYNKLYRELGVDWAQRYVLDPPEGKIGGHCVTPNARLLDEQFPSELLKMIKEYE